MSAQEELVDRLIAAIEAERRAARDYYSGRGGDAYDRAMDSTDLLLDEVAES